MSESAAPQKPTLRELRDKKPAKHTWARRVFPWLFHWDSAFYYGVFLFLLAAIWTIYPLIFNSFTQLLNWDYTWQYISFTYNYWDAWHTFFTTGHLPLYDAGLFLGGDMIGSGAYYGFCDPFMFVCYLFPRSWIPHTYVLMTFAKLMFGGLMMRGYLKEMGIREWTARIGGIVYAFSGFTTFYEGFPNFTSAMAFFPLILWGIERVLRKREPTLLIVGLAGLGMSCFFYVPVLCIFGVIYAVWRFFATIKTRDKNQNIMAMVLGVCGFAIGLMLSAFAILPSVRQSLLSGRSASIGSAYLHTVLNTLKTFDFKMFFTYVFEEVGDNPGRELMGLISFFFPTGGWTNLPLARSGYDAWTSSLFCYTPCVILFFAAIINSVRLRKWSHLVVVVLCVYAAFTNFSYFFFYAFTGNGYGRWYLVLVPLIVYYCCWAFDLRKEEPAFIPFAASVMALIGTIFTFYVTEGILGGKTFSYATYNPNHTTYWQTSYHTASEIYGSVDAAWYFYYQLAFVLIEGTLLCVGHRRKWLKFALLGMASVEVAVMGGLSYAFNGTWSYDYSYAGGTETRESSLVMTNAINANDSSFFRTYCDTSRGSNYTHNVFGVNSPSSFHSLMNFDVETFALNNQIKLPGGSNTTYGGESYYNPRWSGHYANKRYATDTLLGMRYYIIQNNYSGWKDNEGNPLFLPANVPFDAEEMVDYSPNRDRYRVYRRNESSLPNLGYAVSSDTLYRMKYNPDSEFKNQFFNYWNGRNSYLELEWVQYVETHGAILEDDCVLPESFTVKENSPAMTSDQALTDATGGKLKRLVNGSGLTMDYYVTESDDRLLAGVNKSYYHEGLAYFLNHYKTKQSNLGGQFSMAKDFGKLAIRPSSGEFFNTDENGCYMEFHFYNNKNEGAPRVYAIGDRKLPSGEWEENVCLSFDHQLLPSATATDYYCREACTFGLYAQGKVRYFVLCYGSSGFVSVNPSDFYLSVVERSDIKAFEAQIGADALQEVKTETNRFLFKTNYAEDRIVLTQLGFDKGWSATATLPGGQKVKCQMLKLDGGLVGFLAPSAKGEGGEALPVEYVLEYKTPYGNLSAVLYVTGIVCYVGILVLSFVSLKKKRKESLALQTQD
ncbi:MAG: YfhO family protein [Bacilli bacterium]|nr:YfhO family protein [Bacilli bacterium]